MAIDTLAYAKALEAAGLSRDAAEAQVEAFAKHVLPDIVTRDYLDQRVEQLEHRLIQRIDRSGHDLTMRTLAIVGLMDAVLFALLRFVH
jgi:hypothetical protein